MRLSASQSLCLLRCSREWSFKYLDNLKEPKSKALLIGSAFHEILDGKVPDFSELRAMDADYPFAQALDVMKAGYDLAWPHELTEVGREFVYEDGDIKAIADGIAMSETTNEWFIVENKTRTELDHVGMLKHDLQLSLYNRLAAKFADLALVDPDLYGGIIYTATKKPAQRRSKKESVEDFSTRLTSETFVYVIEKDALLLNVGQTLAKAGSIGLEAEKFYEFGGSLNVPGNPNACMRYGSTCPFFARCHGDEAGIRLVYPCQAGVESIPGADASSGEGSTATE
jgi:hypothetical protein